jgi:23S rRNA (cytidine1920-2'-O)/16S rRNA (cytidine1409-2'-O)-methyltransferase
MRLDQFLVSKGYFSTRARARDAILRGVVLIDGATALKPSQNVMGEPRISVREDEARYVSRAALKLIHALDHFAIDAAVDLALDLGASTGGFTQVLLDRGARRVVAVDVGHGQLAPSLGADSRVLLIERLNARDLTREHLPAPPQLVTCDVSFISLTLALPPALRLAAPGARLVALIKPQFEAGRGSLDRSGVVTDRSVHVMVCAHIREWLDSKGSWRVLDVTHSPILGGDGNREFLIAAEKQR